MARANERTFYAASEPGRDTEPGRAEDPGRAIDSGRATEPGRDGPERLDTSRLYDLSSKCDAPILDVRPEAEFLRSHSAGAVNIPFEELAARVHELPSSNIPIQIADTDAPRAEQAASFLTRRGHLIKVLPWDASTATESGPSVGRLWSPNPFLLEALHRINSGKSSERTTRPRALDVACGTGRDAVYLAMQGYDVVAVDLLPDALDRARDLAARYGVSIRTIAADLENGGSLPTGPFDLLTVFRYLHRPLFSSLRAAVAPGGYLVYETFHEQNRVAGKRPQNPAHLLKTGELVENFSDFEVLIERDAIERDGRFFSSLLGRRTK
jgi:SAM-dependent methyltransferase